MLLDLLENTLFYSDGGGGGASDPANPDDKGKGADPKGNEETITLTKTEYEAKLNQKYAEGARKAKEGKLEPNPNPEQKDTADLNKNVSADNELLAKVTKMEEELATHKAMNYATDNNIKPEFKEDLVAIIKGKGLEATPENVKKEADKHPEWKYSADGENGGVKPLGSTGGANTPPAVSEREAAAKLFGL